MGPFQGKCHKLVPQTPGCSHSQQGAAPSGARAGVMSGASVGAGTGAGCATDEVRIAPSQWTQSLYESASPDGTLGGGAFQHNVDKATDVRMPITHVRPKPNHLEMLRLKGNHMGRSGLYSWRAFTAKKMKGGEKSGPLKNLAIGMPSCSVSQKPPLPPAGSL